MTALKPNIVVTKKKTENLSKESQLVSKWSRKTQFGAKPGIPGGDKGQ